MLLSASGGTSASLAYDPAMRLYQVTAGATTTRLAYDGLDLIAEYDGSNALLRRHVFGPGVDDPIVWYEGTGTTDRRFLGSDERGSIVSVSDGSGNMLAINSYDEYGIPGAANAGRFQYTGQAWLPELGMQYSKARLYSPTLGRFLQTDPIDVEGGINLYAYVGNDPVNWIDPMGLEWRRICWTDEAGLWRCVKRWHDEDGGGSTGGGVIHPGTPSGPTPGPGGGGSGRPPAPPKPKPEPMPEFCKKEGYKALDSLDALLGKLQWVALAWGALGKTEYYEVNKKAAGQLAIRGYHYLAAARTVLNLGKVAYGDYKGTVASTAFSVVGKSAGADQIAAIAADQLGDQINDALGGNPCK